MDSDSAAKISQILQLTVMKICQSVVNYTDQLAVQVRALNKQGPFTLNEGNKIAKKLLLYKLCVCDSVLVGTCCFLNFTELTVKYYLHVTSPFITYRYCLQGSHQKSRENFPVREIRVTLCLPLCQWWWVWVSDRMGPVLRVIHTVTIGTILNNNDA